MCLVTQHQRQARYHGAYARGAQSQSRGAQSRRAPSRRARGKGRGVHSIVNYEEFDNTYDSQFNSQFDSLTCDVIHVSSVQHKTEDASDEAFVSLDIKIPPRPGIHKMKLKIDTGAQANTLPVRMAKKMFPSGYEAHFVPTKQTL